MPNELQASGLDPAATYYAIVRSAAGLYWSVAAGAFESLNAVNWPNYAIGAATPNAAGDWTGSFPAAIAAAGTYTVQLRIREAAAPAVGDDLKAGPNEIRWNGSAEVVDPPPPSTQSYLGVTEADEIAAAVPASLLAAYLAANPTNKAAALEQATADVDAAGRYQGRRYNPAQVLEFPRVAYEGGARPTYVAYAAGGASDMIWDWDDDAEEAVVPLNVKRAVVYQANAILDGGLARRLAAQHSGLASQSADGVSESYRDPNAAGAGAWGAMLDHRAKTLLERYRLRSGKLL